jgi:hypothetical protein
VTSQNTATEDAPPGSEGRVYQLRVVVSGVSPLIWRRLLVDDDTTIAALHSILQVAFGWHDDHLHEFTIHATGYGISYTGGPGFRDDARTVHLADLGLRETERFTYEYNFFAPWRLDLRVEKIEPASPGKTYPRCTGGHRAGPPEQWHGPWDFLERTQPYLVYEATMRAVEILRGILAADEENELEAVADCREELAELAPLLRLEHFDRRACNKALTACMASDQKSEEDPV